MNRPHGGSAQYLVDIRWMAHNILGQMAFANLSVNVPIQISGQISTAC